MTSNLWSVDPGAVKHALAHFVDGVLQSVGFFPVYLPGLCGVPDVLVIEKMRIYPGGGKQDPNDLIDVSIAAGAFAGCVVRAGGPEPIWYPATEWKRQVKKPIHHGRLWDALTPDERDVFARDCGYSIAEIEAKIKNAKQQYARKGKIVEYSWTTHNLFDATGIGLYYLKRVTDTGMPGFITCIQT